MADDYIKRSDAINAYKTSRSKDNHKTSEGSLVHIQEHNHILHILDKLPAADVVEVVHGEWIEKQIPLAWCDDDVDIAYQCSICGCNDLVESSYCSGCGAKMDGVGN